MPILNLFMLGYAATTDVRISPLASGTRTRRPNLRALLDAFRGADYFRISYVVGWRMKP